MISINATIFIQLLHFLILVFILNRLMFRPLLRLVHDRTSHIDKTLKKVENSQIDTTELINKRISLENDVRKKAREESSHIKNEASDMAEKILDDTREKLAPIREEVKKEIDKQMDAAGELLHGEATVLADEIINKLIGRRIDN
jgi:F-type H+-transporting ATPase subunit b